MTRVFAMAAAMALAALPAAYVALAPLAPTDGPLAALWMLDAATDRLIALLGRSAAVLMLLAAGVAFSVLAAVRAGASRRRQGHHRIRGRSPAVADARPAAPSPPPPDRVAALRRRALGQPPADDFPPAAPPTAVVPAETGGTGMPRPVILIRKPRTRERDWFGDCSWLGGLPRLGDAVWPRDDTGAPLPFAAQIDLAELATACPESPLPRSGSLAFFLGSGAVVAVADGPHDFSEPPPDLPPSYAEGGAPFPAATDPLCRRFFPFWPVAPVTLDLPPPLRDHRDGRQDDAIEAAMASLLAPHAAPRGQMFAADNGGLWWHGVIHLATALRHAGSAAAMPDMVAALDHFIADRNPWQRLSVDECGIIADFLDELHARHGDSLNNRIPRTPRDLATLSLRAMITGAPAAFAALPDAQLARINRDYRLPLLHRHQMFGLGGCQHSAREEHRDDLLLLQLGHDDMMEWRWGEMGLCQFWIAPRHAATGNWAAARLTCESD